MPAHADTASPGTPSLTERFDAMLRAVSPDDRSIPGPNEDRWPAVPGREPVALDDSLRRALELLHDGGRA